MEPRLLVTDRDPALMTMREMAPMPHVGTGRSAARIRGGSAGHVGCRVCCLDPSFHRADHVTSPGLDAGEAPTIPALRAVALEEHAVQVEPRLLVTGRDPALMTVREMAPMPHVAQVGDGAECSPDSRRFSRPRRTPSVWPGSVVPPS
jgi:hypothetical protein